MRRIIMALFAMTTGTALLVGLKSHNLAVPLGIATEQPWDPGQGGGEGPSAAGSTSAAGTTSSPDATQTAVASATATAETGTPPSAPAQPPPPEAPPGVNGTSTGTAVAVTTAQSPNNQSRRCEDCDDYSMSVTITVSNGQITNATVAYSPDPADSKRYANKATNALSPKIVTAQTWLLGNVSGATYSANAFELSAKDAMAQAGLL